MHYLLFYPTLSSHYTLARQLTTHQTLGLEIAQSNPNLLAPLKRWGQNGPELPILQQHHRDSHHFSTNLSPLEDLELAFGLTRCPLFLEKKRQQTEAEIKAHSAQ